MEVKPGYKLTDVGVVPDDWKVVSLSELNPIVTSGSRGWASYYSELGDLFVRITNLSRKSIFLDLNNKKFVKLPPEEREGIRTQLKEHDVLISITADIGIVGYVDANIPLPAYINQHIALVRFDASQVSGKFVSYFLASEKPQKLFRATTDTGAKAGLSLLKVQQIQTAIPPLLEQHEITNALSTLDALLDSLDSLIAKKRDLKQAAMQQLLTGQIRLPGFSGEWDVKRLGDVVEIRKGQLITSSTLQQGDIPVVAGGKQPAYFHSSANCFGRTVTISASGASAGYVALYNEPIFASDCSTIGESDDYCLDFVFFQLVNAQQTIYKAQTGGAQPHIHAKDLNPILFAFPPKSEQTAIAKVLKKMDTELSVIEMRRNKTAALKQGMMQELLTGRTRLV